MDKTGLFLREDGGKINTNHKGYTLREVGLEEHEVGKRVSIKFDVGFNTQAYLYMCIDDANELIKELSKALSQRRRKRMAEAISHFVIRGGKLLSMSRKDIESEYGITVLYLEGNQISVRGDFDKVGIFRKDAIAEEKEDENVNKPR